jgi:hypothetical protein
MDALSSVAGVNIPVWLYRVLAIFPLTGMVAIDHFALGSKQTAFAKSLINIATFGSWYVFDALQSLDGKRIVANGLEIPFYGKAQIGKGKIVEGTGMGTAGNYLNILFTFAAGALYLVSTMFKGAPGIAGKLSTMAQGISLPATMGIGGFTLYNTFKAPPPAASATPGAAIPSFGELAKMVGGGEDEEIGPVGMSMDGVAIGLLLVLAASGFSLAFVRSNHIST